MAVDTRSVTVDGKLIGAGREFPTQVVLMVRPLLSDRVAGDSAVASRRLATPTQAPDGNYLLEYLYHGRCQEMVRVQRGWLV
jgi:hypothetical protein